MKCGSHDDFEAEDDDLLASIPLDYPEQTQTSTTEETEQQVKLPDSFPFPFTPYDIQEDFMKNLYTALELGKIGIFESPTGTGKSLSLICGALKWLKDFEEKQRVELEKLLAESAEADRKREEDEKKKQGELDWVTAFAQKQVQEEETKKLKEEQALRLKRENRLEQLKKEHPGIRVKRKRSLEAAFDELFADAPDVKQQVAAELRQDGAVADDDDLFVVDDYLSDDAAGDEEEEKDGEEEEEEHCTKIYYCSRTHSQLSQFVRELVRSPHGEDTRVVSLGSRTNMCINDAVRRLGAVALINDRCLELQKHKSEKSCSKSGEPTSKRKKGKSGCPFYKHEQIQQYTDRTLVSVGDLEQLVARGRKMKACPYYGTRFAVPAAQVVALPYNTLLHRSTRDSVGIRLRGNVVVIDEAHNLAETISSVHSVTVTGNQLTCAHSQLAQYMERYRARLKAKNLMYLQQLSFILNSFIRVLGGRAGEPADQQHVGPAPGSSLGSSSGSAVAPSDTKLHTLNDFLFHAQLDNLNLFKIMTYCQKSMISRKLHGFVEKYQPPVAIKKEVEIKEEKPPTWALSKFLEDIKNNKNKKGSAKENKSPNDTASPEAEAAPPAYMSSPLMAIEGFIEALTNTDKDGRIVVTKQDLLSESCLKFMLLNPAVHFAEVVREARAVIVAGGTMQPVSEFKDQLFFATGVKPERILEFSCGHVIPPEQLLPLALARGSSGQEFDFTYQNRNSPAMMEELGRVVYNVCNVVPGGVVVFFPSYDYEKLVYSHWEKTGFIEKIASRKKILREPKLASQVDQVLHDYGNFIKKALANKYSPYTGSVLFCVVGAKMSEGINFADDMGRCVIMVGLPYPNIRSPELKEKMDYLNLNMPRASDGRLPGQVHYENLCMKAVNQSIGRAIRHKDDYSCILLCDHRYLRPSMKTKLPGWIARSLQCMDRFGPAFASIRNFFQERRGT